MADTTLRLATFLFDCAAADVMLLGEATIGALVRAYGPVNELRNAMDRAAGTAAVPATAVDHLNAPRGDHVAVIAGGLAL